MCHVLYIYIYIYIHIIHMHMYIYIYIIQVGSVVVGYMGGILFRLAQRKALLTLVFEAKHEK